MGELCVKWLLVDKFIFKMVLFGLINERYVVVLVWEFEWVCIFVNFVLNNFLVWLIVKFFMILINL